MRSRDKLSGDEWTIQPKSQGVYVAQRSRPSLRGWISREKSWIIPTVVSIIAFAVATCFTVKAVRIASDTLQAAIAPVLYEDSDDYCTQKSSLLSADPVTATTTKINKLAHSEFTNLDNLYDCTAATENDARKAVRTYILRSAGADPFRGWELLSKDLQATWSYDSFMARWQLVGYAEVGKISGPNLTADDLESTASSNGDNNADSLPGTSTRSESLPFNTFDVEIRQYQLIPETNQSGKPVNEADLSSGWITTSFYEVHLRQAQAGWVIDSMVSTDRTVGGREYVKYGKVQLKVNKSSWQKRSHDDPTNVAWTNKNADYGILPVYCIVNDDSDVWYRTSLGWVLDSDSKEVSPDIASEPKSFSKKDPKFNGRCLNSEDSNVIELDPATPDMVDGQARTSDIFKN